MPVTSIDKDPENLMMTIVADFPVPVRRLWDAYADPRQLEKFWGPPEYPATFTRHDLYPGGRSEYFMTGPAGNRSFNFWEFLSVAEGESFEIISGFADENGEPNTHMPTMRMHFTFEESAQGSRLVGHTTFNSLEEMEQLIGMGMVEGTKAAMAQIDDVVADLASFAAGRALEATLIGETHVRISRVVRGTPQQVWEAHHNAELIRRWLYCPEGWSMTDCQAPAGAGSRYRYAFEPGPDAEGEAFALVGEVLESEPPRRTVFLETMEDIEGPPARNEQTFTPVEGGTLLSLVIAYASAEHRDIVLGTGMTDGIEISYSRLDEVLAA